MSVAIVHEWLTNRAGSERCVEALAKAFPNHRIYASVVNEDAFPEWAHDSGTSFLQRIGPVRRSHILGLAAMPLAMRTLRLRPTHDLVIRSFHSFATMPRISQDVPEVVYCYTPPRFLYRSQSLSGEGPLVRAGTQAISTFLRRGDQRRMRRPARVIAISAHIAREIARVYGIEAGVIHPPVDVDTFRTGSSVERGEHFVMCGRLVPYKRPDIVIDAFRHLPFPLQVIGGGRMQAQLENSAPPNVAFLGHVDSAELPRLIGTARGFVFAGVEDFGIALVEALAAGTPVVTRDAGGALDYIRHGINGILVESASPDALAEGVRKCAANNWDHGAIAETAEPFSAPRFVDAFRRVAEEILAR